MPNNKPIQLQTYLRLIAIGIDPERDAPELYYLLLEGIKDKPVMDSEFIIFFPDPQQARLIAEKFANNQEIDQIDIEQPFMVCDIADTLHYITEGGYDGSCIVLNSANLLLDLIDAADIPSTAFVLPILREIADFCTLSTDLTELKNKQSPYSTNDRINAVLLAIGAVLTRARIVK